MPKKIKLVEIARSFSYKMALPNYSNVDFFCSEKAEVPESEAEKKSEELYQFCRKEISKSVEAYKEELLAAKKEEPVKLIAKDFVEAKKEAPESQFIADKATELVGEEKIKEGNREADEMLTTIPEPEIPTIEEKNE